MKDIMPTECGCPEMIEKFKALGAWQEGSRVKPQPGWIIFYDWQGDGTSDHVGIVEKAGTKNITVIEGNKSDAVGRRTIAIGDKSIKGYGVPKFEAKASTKLSTEPKWVGRVTAGLLNVRRWAGVENPNIKSYPILASGNLVDVCDETKDTSGRTWYYIRIAGKWFGFVDARYITQN